MSKYTIYLGNMFNAWLNANISINSDKIADYFDSTNQNKLIEKYGAQFMNDNLINIPKNYTSDDGINTKISDKLLTTFLRHFYNTEIGQENPDSWWILLQSFFDEYLPIFIQQYQQLFIENAAFITGISDSTAHNTGEAHGTGSGSNAAIGGDADTPQNELNFKLATGDPTDDYNFHYSSSVNGSKGISAQKQDSNSIGDTTTHTQGRSQSIASLVNQLETFTNGAYINLFQHAKERWLFMAVNN